MSGMAEGYKEAMRAMYPDAYAFVGEEPSATRLVLTVVALEELVNG